MNAWSPQASYPCGNFSDTSCLKPEKSEGCGAISPSFASARYPGLWSGNAGSSTGFVRTEFRPYRCRVPGPGTISLAPSMVPSSLTQPPRPDSTSLVGSLCLQFHIRHSYV
ncbi:hypothetical protein JRQ81_009004 [Phrynocephalus forsythii]|uniref:Uncharacterized protein n=1 Tax=Phrynocephalus forsythii TaxID=171643 RepID=A0A9Q0XB82_9SAUR|nr:hypothetical protein JRQ81_009004 [Phrynocephalus forsythii]